MENNKCYSNNCDNYDNNNNYDNNLFLRYYG